MARNDKEKYEKSAQTQASKETPRKVFMRFSEDQFYNDQSVPKFNKGEVYELEGQDWINRWLKRGGEIVEKLAKEEKAVASARPETVGGDIDINPAPIVPTEPASPAVDSGLDRSLGEGNEE